MEIKVASEALRLIREERGRRVAALQALDPEHADDQWTFVDGPFLNELCLTSLVGIRHQSERELVFLAAKVANGAPEISGADFDQRVKAKRAQLRQQNDWKIIETALQLKSFPEWQGSMQVLRLVVNTWKHDPWGAPGRELLELLKLDTQFNCASLAESEAVVGGLGAYLGLGPDAGYCEVATELLRRSADFIQSVREQQLFARVKRGPVSLDPRDFLQ